MASDPKTVLSDETFELYRRALVALQAAGVPFLVGGAWALHYFTGIARQSKDLDVFLERDRVDEAGRALGEVKCGWEVFSPHWLAKGHCSGEVVDLIFSSGNGVATVDRGWFEHAPEGCVFGVPVLICPLEETLWMKAFIMERERFDGADVAHLLHAAADRLDWHRLLARFGANWRVLLAHLVLFGFIYPDRRRTIPRWVMDDLLARERAEDGSEGPAGVRPLCRGTLLSRSQYAVDIDERGYCDARLTPHGGMTVAEVAAWTELARADADAEEARLRQAAIDRREEKEKEEE